MFENLKETAKFEYKDSYDITDKIEEELIKIEKNSHKYASKSFMDILSQVKDQKDPLNITSVGENIFYHGIHFLKGRGWTEESIVEAVRNHFRLYDDSPEEETEEETPKENTTPDKK